MIHLSTDLVHFQYLFTKSFTQVAILECPRDHFGSNNLQHPSWFCRNKIGDLYLGYIQCSLKWESHRSVWLVKIPYWMWMALTYDHSLHFSENQSRLALVTQPGPLIKQATQLTAQTAYPNKNKTHLEHRRGEPKQRTWCTKMWKLCMMNQEFYYSQINDLMSTTLRHRSWSHSTHGVQQLHSINALL